MEHATRAARISLVRGEISEFAYRGGRYKACLAPTRWSRAPQQRIDFNNARSIASISGGCLTGCATDVGVGARAAATDV